MPLFVVASLCAVLLICVWHISKPLTVDEFRTMLSQPDCEVVEPVRQPDYPFLSRTMLVRSQCGQYLCYCIYSWRCFALLPRDGKGYFFSQEEFLYLRAFKRVGNTPWILLVRQPLHAHFVNEELVEWSTGDFMPVHRVQEDLHMDLLLRQIRSDTITAIEHEMRAQEAAHPSIA